MIDADRRLLALAHRHRFLLTMEEAALEVRAAEMAPLLDLNTQLERLGHRFVRLERLPDAK